MDSMRGRGRGSQLRTAPRPAVGGSAERSESRQGGESQGRRTTMKSASSLSEVGAATKEDEGEEARGGEMKA
jgi:hypothetical protein